MMAFLALVVTQLVCFAHGDLETPEFGRRKAGIYDLQTKRIVRIDTSSEQNRKTRRVKHVDLLMKER